MFQYSINDDSSSESDDIPNNPAQFRKCKLLYTEEEEDPHQQFPLDQYLSPELTNLFASFTNDQHLPLCILPTLPPPYKIPNFNQISIDYFTFFMADISSIKPRENIIHTWVNLNSIISFESKLLISKTLIKSCNNFSSQRPHILAEVLDDKSFPASYPRTTTDSRLNMRIFHYIGIGLPSPEADRIYFQAEESCPLNNSKLLSFIIPPSFLIFDCPHAAILMPALIKLSKNHKRVNFPAPESNDPFSSQFFLFFSCQADETLHIPMNLPQNFFTCSLLTPAKSYESVYHIKPSPIFLQLLDIITESIALQILPTPLFYQLFRSNEIVSSLWRRFIFAQRMMIQFGAHVVSYPSLPDCTRNPLWIHFDYCQSAPNVLNQLFDLYSYFFIKFSSPNYSLANYEYNESNCISVVSSLLRVHELRPKILSIFAKYMRESPMHCRAVGHVIDFHQLGDYHTISIGNPIDFCNWSTIVSGMLLTIDGMAKIITQQISPWRDLSTVVSSSTIDQKIKVYLLSILVCIQDCNISGSGVYHGENALCSIMSLFSGNNQKSKPPEDYSLLRLWAALLLHSALSKFTCEPSQSANLKIHAYASLLLKERSYLIRATAVSILGYLLSQRHLEFSSALITAGAPAAVDGSSLVRLSYLSALGRYLAHSGFSAETDGPTLAEILDPPSGEFEPGAPWINTILQILSVDPSDQVAIAAQNLIDGKYPKDEFEVDSLNLITKGYEISFEEANDIYDENKDYEQEEILSLESNGRQLHKIAHTFLFSERVASTIKERYENVVLEGPLQFMENIKVVSSKIVCLKFIDEIICGTDNGIVKFGKNEIIISKEPISDIYLINDVTAAVGSGNGIVSIIQYNVDENIDAFRPEIIVKPSPILICGSPRHCLISGNTSVFWDIEALLPIGIALFPNQILAMTYLEKDDGKEGTIFAALNDGSIGSLDQFGFSIIVSSISMSQKGIEGHPLSLFVHKGKLYASYENGMIVLLEKENPKTKFILAGNVEFGKNASWNPKIIRKPYEDRNLVVQYIAHNELPYAIEISRGTAFLINFESQEIVSELKAAHSPSCASFHQRKNLVAIGNNDGFVSVWRLPIQY